MAKRKYPRMKKCKSCHQLRFLRCFKRVGRGKGLANWSESCLFCEPVNPKGNNHEFN